MRINKNIYHLSENKLYKIAYLNYLIKKKCVSYL